MIPVLSVARISGQYFAFVAEDNGKGGLVARQRKVQVGEHALGDNYVVEAGLKAGDKIITSGTQLLVDGTRNSAKRSPGAAFTRIALHLYLLSFVENEPSRLATQSCLLISSLGARCSRRFARC